MKYCVFIIVLLVFLGCTDSDRPAKPDNLIGEAQMSDIIYDVFLLNAAKGINKRILENNGILPQEYVYKKYSIDSLQFAKSNDYYSYDVKTYESIMERVKQRLELEKALNDSITSQEERRKDSLNAAKKELRTMNDTLLKTVDTLIKLKPSLSPKSLKKRKKD